MIWLQFLLLASVIGIAGVRLSFYGDKIAEETGASLNLVGLILLASITSLPELVSGISAVTVVKDPNLAVGDVLGSCLFNLLIVFLLDLFHRESVVYGRVKRTHILTAALGIVLIGFVGFSLLVAPHLQSFDLGHAGILSLSLPVLYILAMRMLYAYEHAGHGEPVQQRHFQIRKLKTRTLVYFTAAAAVVVLAGSYLPSVAAGIIEQMNWNSAFVGTIFLAFATSLPEIAVTLGAVRIGSADLAFSNVLGSNLFNVVILTIDDLFYAKGSLLASVESAHAITAFSAVMMTGLVLIALLQPPQRKLLNQVTGLSLILLGVYLFNAYIIFRMG